MKPILGEAISLLPFTNLTIIHNQESRKSKIKRERERKNLKASSKVEN